MTYTLQALTKDSLLIIISEQNMEQEMDGGEKGKEEDKVVKG